jgi:imidazolonepropionase-like amidohydrolase
VRPRCGLDSQLGRVAPGLQADLVVVKGDLGEDPAAIREVELVFRLGTGFRAASLLADVEGQVGLR